MVILGLVEGKDTIGTIIQYLTRDKNTPGTIGLTLNEFLTNRSYDYSTKWEIKKFAYKLKQIASILTGIPQEKFEDQEFKKTFLGEEWSSFPKSKAENLEDYKKEFEDALIWGKSKLSVREFLQKLGTDAIRDGLHPNTWVNALMSEYKEVDTANYDIRENSFVFPYIQMPNWIITDVRFPNEAKAIKEREGIIIRVNRLFSTYEEEDIGKVDYIPFKHERHSSETSLDDWNFDYIIENNGTIEELIGKVRKMIGQFKII